MCAHHPNFPGIEYYGNQVLFNGVSQISGFLHSIYNRKNHKNVNELF